MIFTLCFAALLAKIKHNKIHYLFKTWTIYPALIFDIFYVIFQVCIFMNVREVIQFAPFIKYPFLLSFLIPMVVYNLYKAGIIGSFSIAIGSVLNTIVMKCNNGKMPVYPSFSYITGYVNSNAFQMQKDIHILGNSQTHLKFLTDYLDNGFSVLSIGDLFIHFYVFIMVYSLIVTLNKKHKQEDFD